MTESCFINNLILFVTELKILKIINEKKTSKSINFKHYFVEI